MKRFKKGDIPPTVDFRLYQKKVKTQAVRINGVFEVETTEGTLTCQDGYLCLDARGYPYPVAADEFKLIYEEAP